MPVVEEFATELRRHATQSASWHKVDLHNHSPASLVIFQHLILSYVTTLSNMSGNMGGILNDDSSRLDRIKAVRCNKEN